MSQGADVGVSAPVAKPIPIIKIDRQTGIGQNPFASMRRYLALKAGRANTLEGEGKRHMMSPWNVAEHTSGSF